MENGKGNSEGAKGHAANPRYDLLVLFFSPWDRVNMAGRSVATFAAQDLQVDLTVLIASQA